MRGGGVLGIVMECETVLGPQRRSVSGMLRLETVFMTRGSLVPIAPAPLVVDGVSTFFLLLSEPLPGPSY